MTKKLVVGIVDYGMGNTRSVANALAALGIEPLIGADHSLLKSADALILPGVGAFDAAMWNLARQKLDDPLRDWIFSGRPLLGICLGMQLLVRESEEGSACPGLGVIDGRVQALRPAAGLRVPHVGWNSITSTGNGLFSGIADGSHCYFDHGYHVQCDASLACAHFEHGGRYIAALRSGSLFGTQFHPEKSQRHGMSLLRNFIRYSRLSLMPGAWREMAMAEAAFA